MERVTGVNFNIDCERCKEMGQLYFNYHAYSTDVDLFEFEIFIPAPDDELFTSKAIDNCEAFFHNLICEYLGTVNENCIIDSEHCYYYIRREIMENGIPDECKQRQK